VLRLAIAHAPIDPTLVVRFVSMWFCPSTT